MLSRCILSSAQRSSTTIQRTSNHAVQLLLNNASRSSNLLSVVSSNRRRTSSNLAAPSASVSTTTVTATPVANTSSSSKSQQEGFSSSSSSSFTSTNLLLSALGLSIIGGAFLLTTAYADEGDSEKTKLDYDVGHGTEDEEGGERHEGKLMENVDGEIEWMSTSTRPRIVILGTGWGSVSFLKGLDINKYEIVVISPRNYFLFTPLLPSACTGTIEIGSLTEPIRQILLSRHQTRQQQYVEAKAVGLDREKRKLTCVDSNGREFLIEYDHLLIGVGANNNTFNTPGVKEYAFFLKEAKHARLIRKEILDHFERASSPTTSIAEKEALLQFVIVGGGPTGVEFAGEMVDFLEADLLKQFPQLIPYVRVRLIQSQDHILNTYDAAISRYAEAKFKELRIEVITGARVKAITKDSLTYEDKTTKAFITIPFGIALWSTGIQMNDFTKIVSKQIRGQESEKALVTDEYLRLLQEIPELDRVPKRIIQDAAKVIAPQAASGANTKLPSGASPPPAPPASQPQAESAPRDLDVDQRVYAFGDCATTYIPKLSKRLKPLFKAADTNGDGRLSYDELHELCYTISSNFPVMSSQMAAIMGQYDSIKDPNDSIDFAKFEKMVLNADKNARVYPATAQVASQQGRYLARRFNAFALEQCKKGEMKDVGGADHEALEQKLVKPGQHQRRVHPPITPSGMDGDSALRPFRYKHMGNLAYIGGETAAIDLGQGGAYTGTAAFWLWKSAYLSESVSTRTRINLAFDWTRSWFFGRDTSKP